MIDVETPRPTEQRRKAPRRLVVAGLLTAAAIVAIALVAIRKDDPVSPADQPSPTVTVPPPLLQDGPIEPGRYRYVLKNACDDPPHDCPVGVSPPPALGIDLTVPDGWTAVQTFHLIQPSTPVAEPTNGPDGAGLILGWTNFWVGLFSDPCTHTDEQLADTPVGPTVDDFVDAVLANPTLGVTEPTDVTLGRHHGRFFTLTAPSDIDNCASWRPWDPGFRAQGANNVWDVWVMDVDGFRVLVVAQYFPDTPPDTRAQLRQMVESVQFAPAP